MKAQSVTRTKKRYDAEFGNCSAFYVQKVEMELPHFDAVAELDFEHIM
jgi:hypothetical protein